MSQETLRERVGRVIFETHTPQARVFDVILLVVILASVAAVVLESVPSMSARWGETLRALEWAFTVAFTVEYVLRVYSAPNRRRYVLSYFGVVDLLAVLPTYLSLIFPGAQYALVIRSLRLLRVFRVLKLAEYIDDADLLVRALRASREKILVFLFAVVTIVLIAGTSMYLVEGPENGFESIPISVYWAIVTLTTVGFGDFIPVTPVGRFLAAVLMVTGYAIIAVPTGIVTTEIGFARRRSNELRRVCARCGAGGHLAEANYCYNCGERLPA
ncbi:MAG TPA: ion transporter [Trueperaceae bacterium]